MRRCERCGEGGSSSFAHGNHCTHSPTSTSAAPARTAPVRHRTPLLAELDREWARLGRRQTGLHSVRRWVADDPALAAIAASAHDLDDVVTATQVGRAAGDELLRRLLVLSPSEPLAGRIVLQRLLPGLISRARRWTSASTDGDPTDIVIGAAWIAIRDFDVGRRHRFIAPALIADSLWGAFRRDTRRKQSQEVLVPTNTLAGHPAPLEALDPLVALAATMRAAARAGVGSADLDLIRAIVAARSPSQAARSCEVSVRTIRNRRDAAADRIATALGPEWCDWSDPLVAAA